MDKPDCTQCRKLKAMKGKRPNCNECLPPLERENQIPMYIFEIVRDQVIMGPSGVFAIDSTVLRGEINRIISDTTDQDIVYHRVRKAHQHMLDKLRESDGPTGKPIHRNPR